MRDHSSSASGAFPQDWNGSSLNTDKVEAWQITPIELNRRIELGEPIVLIDVREQWESNIASLPGSRVIPLNELRYRAEEEMEYDDDVVLYCHHGIRSMEAALILWDIGYDRVKSLAGGIDRWSLEVDPSMPKY